jgi:exosome complex RNA-binding protein Rrp42 (RNase PH superfamily)
MNPLKFAYTIQLCSSSEEEVLISRTIEKALRRSRAVDTEGLCIVAGEKVRLIAWSPAFRMQKGF